MPTIFGLDFGTTNSVLAINTDDKCRVIDLDKDAPNKKTLRSVLYFNEDKDIFIGQQAIDEYVKNGAHGRFMQSIKSFLPSSVFDRAMVYGKSYEIDDLIAIVIKGIKKIGEESAGHSVDSVVVGRPSVFSENQQNDRLAEERLRSALVKSGFKNIYFQYEPIAAALSHESTLENGQEKIILVGDFGGGTSDFTVIKLRGGDQAKKKQDRKDDVLSVGGVYIGGDTFDSRVMWDKLAKYFGKDVQYKAMSGGALGFPAWIVYRFCRWHLIQQLNDRKTREFLKQLKRIADDPKAIVNLENLIDDNYGFMLFQAIEKAKCELSNLNSTTIDFKERDLLIKEAITRPEFDQIIREDRDKIEECINETLKQSGVGINGIDFVLLTGGSSKIPCIKNIFIDRFGNDKIVQADEFSSVAYGLAVNGSQYI